MKLYVNGDSFTECYSLPSRDDSWPVLLANYLNCQLDNDAVGGGSNERIVRTTQKYLATNRPDFIVIGWTDICRAELPAYNGQWIRITPQASLIDDKSLHNNPDIKPLAEAYYKWCHNQYLSAECTLIGIITIQQLLTYYKIPYLFFNSINSDLFCNNNEYLTDLAQECFDYCKYEDVQFPESINVTKSYLNTLISKIDSSRWIGGLSNTYINLCKNHPCDSSGHFLEEGNSCLFNLIKSTIDNETICKR